MKFAGIENIESAARARGGLPHKILAKIKNRNSLFMIVLLLILNLLILEFWSIRPTWIDADLYARRLELGLLVSHPPGSLVFLIFGQLIYLFIGDAYLSLQLISHFSYLGSIPLMYIFFSRILQRNHAAIFTVAYAVSWLPLLISNVGTSHASDLLFGSAILVVASSAGFRQSHRSAITLCFILLTLSGGFRMTTLLLWLPGIVVLFLSHRAPWRTLWPGMLILIVGSTIIMLLTIHFHGGWNLYSERVQSLNQSNAQVSMITNGINKQTLLNSFRSVLWFVVQFSVLLFFLPHVGLRRGRLPTGPPGYEHGQYLLPAGFLISTIAPPLLVMVFYYGSHPGYLAPVVPAMFALIAGAWQRRKQRKGLRLNYILLTMHVVLSICIFFGFRFIRQPSTVEDAVLNGLLLQYSRDGVKNAAIKPLSEWLLLAGRKDLVPPSRLEAIEERHK